MIRVTFSGSRVAWPRMCVCCGDHAETQITVATHRTEGVKVRRTKTKTYDVPYCHACVHHANEYPQFGCLYMCLTLITCGLFLPVFLYLRMSAKERMNSTCSDCEFNALIYEGWHGSTNTFLFKNNEVAFEFMLANQKKLLNVPYELEDALYAYERHKEESHYAPNPNAALSISPVMEQAQPTPKITPSRRKEPATDPEDAVLSKALSKIESARGPASRRNARDAALKQLHNPENEKRLWVEYCQIATEATLQKADTLKTDKAKKRNLEAMLEELQENPVPDELKAKQISLLREALDDLG